MVVMCALRPAVLRPHLTTVPMCDIHACVITIICSMVTFQETEQMNGLITLLVILFLAYGSYSNTIVGPT